MLFHEIKHHAEIADKYVEIELLKLQNIFHPQPCFGQRLEVSSRSYLKVLFFLHFALLRKFVRQTYYMKK